MGDLSSHEEWGWLAAVAVPVRVVVGGGIEGLPSEAFRHAAPGACAVGTGDGDGRGGPVLLPVLSRRIVRGRAEVGTDECRVLPDGRSAL
jgi:hypothetical protein